MLLVWVVALLGQGSSAAYRLTGLSWVALTCLAVWQSSVQTDRWACLAQVASWFSVSLGLAIVHLLSQHLTTLQRQSTQQAQALQASFHTITQLATHDELTGLSNRRHMTDLIAREQQRQRRTHAPVCMAMLDLDHFKKVNDAFGHAAGDVVLTTFARTLRQTMRATDEISRWGGEEFLLLMPNTSLEEATLAVERLRTAQQTASLAWVSPVTFSAGIVLAAEGLDMDQVIACADEAMYRAKTQGRNCSVVQTQVSDHLLADSFLSGNEKIRA
jgi:diguanylate cyclase (GGDEF)-like protein